MRGFKRTDADSSVLFLPKTTQYFLLSFLNIVTIFRPCPAAAYFTGTVRLSHVMLNWITKHFWHISRNIADCCNLLTRLRQIVRIPGTETKPLELSIGLRESWRNRRIFADQNTRQISHLLWGQAFPTNWVYYEISRISVDSFALVVRLRGSMWRHLNTAIQMWHFTAAGGRRQKIQNHVSDEATISLKWHLASGPIPS